MTQSVSISLAVDVDQGVQTSLSSLKNHIDFDKVVQLLDGTGAGKANKTYAASRTIAGSGSDPLDLAGVLADAFGAPLTFTKVRAIAIAASSANASTIKMGAGTAPMGTLFGANTERLVIRPGGFVLITAPDATGYAVTATTADTLTISNDSASLSAYDIVIVGE